MKRLKKTIIEQFNNRKYKDIRTYLKEVNNKNTEITTTDKHTIENTINQ